MGSSPNNTSQPGSLDEWVETLYEREMPIFSNTAQKIYATLDDRNKGAMELASVILQDPSLTAKLLKMSNSTYYNPARQKINTVSRAIVILGSELIRELTLACVFIESIMLSGNKIRANQEIAHAIHAAVHAKEMAIICNDSHPEEVFIATLLNNIGKIAFWCFCGKKGQYINDLLKSGDYSENDAEEKVLGFNLNTLGLRLAQTWKLSGLIENAIAHPTSGDKRIQLVHLGKKITHNIEFGWDSEELNICVSEIEKSTNLPQKAIKNKLKNNTELAIKVAQQFGANDASKFIQATDTQSTQVLIDDSSEPSTDKKQIQFQILQDITTMMTGNINLNRLFEMVMEGIHRGVDMDRSLFTLLTPDKKLLKEKISLGWFKESYSDVIKFQPSPMPANLFNKALHSSDGLWARPSEYGLLYTPHVINSIGMTECFLMPVFTNNNPIGLIYTDRSLTKKPLTQDDFNAVIHFAQQANIGLAMYRIKKN